ncbi:MAG: Shedu anti-phage system protein SduA domain-containing protein, partial [Nitrososphaerales archaeon]
MNDPVSGSPEPRRAVRVSSTSRQTADIDPIVLRETSTTRLIFRPVLLDNPGNPAAPMDGTFIFQRKAPNDGWTDFNELPLSRLRATEWVKIDLKAAELLTLFEGLAAYYDLVLEHGLVQGTQEFIPAPRSRTLRSLIMNEAQFHEALRDEEVASALLGGLVAWIAGNERAVAAARLDGISLEELQQFDAVLGLARLQRFCRELDDNADNDDEAYWQRTLESNGWAIAQVYAVPVMLIHSQVYVGGKRITNRSGNTADFLYANGITGNVVLVEIKTPVTPLLGSPYRNNVVNVSADLSGGLMQILNAQRSLTENFTTLMTDDSDLRRPLSPRGLLIVGSATQLRTHPQK